MIYKKRYGQPFDTESVVGSFLPMMETIPYLTKEPDGFSYAMDKSPSTSRARPMRRPSTPRSR